MVIMAWMGPKGTKETWACKARREIRYTEKHNILWGFLFKSVLLLCHRVIQENQAYQETRGKKGRRWRLDVFSTFAY